MFNKHAIGLNEIGTMMFFGIMSIIMFPFYGLFLNTFLYWFF